MWCCHLSSSLYMVSCKSLWHCQPHHGTPNATASAVTKAMAPSVPWRTCPSCCGNPRYLMHSISRASRPRLLARVAQSSVAHKTGSAGRARPRQQAARSATRTPAQPAKHGGPYLSYAETLGLRRSPTLLYQAPSHTLYALGSYGFALFCFSYAGYNFHAHYLHPPPGLSAWVPVAFGGVCVGMACLGTWLVLGPTR